MKRSTKIIAGTLIGLGLVSVVAARQFDDCGFGPGMRGMGQGYHAEWISKRISHRLDLNDAQQLELEKLQDSMLQRFDGMRQQRLSEADIQSLLNNEFDQLKAQQLLDQRLEVVNRNAPQVIANIAGFYNQLDGEQQQQVREMVSKRMAHRGHRWGHSEHADER